MIDILIQRDITNEFNRLVYSGFLFAGWAVFTLMIWIF